MHLFLVVSFYSPIGWLKILCAFNVLVGVGVDGWMAKSEGGRADGMGCGMGGDGRGWEGRGGCGRGVEGKDGMGGCVWGELREGLDGGGG